MAKNSEKKELLPRDIKGPDRLLLHQAKNGIQFHIALASIEAFSFLQALAKKQGEQKSKNSNDEE